MKKKRIKPAGRNSFRVISVGFMILILTGALLLMLPIASQSSTVTPFKDALFTAISASCVTGLVVKDTATHWSLFGQAVILTLIQIGGMGVITIGLIITRLSGRKIGLGFRGMMQDSISAPPSFQEVPFADKDRSLHDRTVTAAAGCILLFCRILR